MKPDDPKTSNQALQPNTNLQDQLNYLRDSKQLHESRHLNQFHKSLSNSQLRSNNWNNQSLEPQKFEMTHLLDSTSHKTWKKKTFEQQGKRTSKNTIHTNSIDLGEMPKPSRNTFQDSSSNHTRPRQNVSPNHPNFDMDLARSIGSDLRFSDEAVQLIRVSPEGQFEVTMQGLSLLRSFQGPIAVLGVAGKFRTGKSYLLNRVILRTERGFGVAPTINACTKGIWMYGKPIRVTLKDGRDANLVVLDSEGLDAIDQDASHDCRILALMMLLTSMFVYNSVGAIDENAISSLSLVINLTKHIRVRARPEKEEGEGKENNEEQEDSDDDEEDPEELAQFFPNFLWVLRDFSLELVDQNGKQITPKEYLENALALHKGISDTVQEKNRLRRLICQFFPERNCFPLVRPVLEEDELQRLNELPTSRLRPEFVDASQHLRQRLFSQARPKTLKNKSIDGNCLAGLIVQYVRAINHGAVPNIESAWTYVCANQRQNLKKDLLAEFVETVQEQFANGGPIQPNEIKNRLKTLVKEFMCKLRNGALDGLIKEESRQFKETLTNIAKRVEIENLEGVKIELTEVLNQKFRREVVKHLDAFEREKTADKKMERERDGEAGEETWVEKEGQTWDKVEEKLCGFADEIQNMEIGGAEQRNVCSMFLFEKLLTRGSLAYRSLLKTLNLFKLDKNSKIALLQEKCESQTKRQSEKDKSYQKRQQSLLEAIERSENELNLAQRQIELKSEESRARLKEREKDLNNEIKGLNEKIAILQTETQNVKEIMEKMNEEQRGRESERETEVVLLTQKVEFLEKEKVEWGERKRRFGQERREEEERARRVLEEVRKGAELDARMMRGEMKKLETTMLGMREDATHQSILQENINADWTTKTQSGKHLLVETQRERDLLLQTLEKQRDRHQEWQTQIEDLKTNLHTQNTETIRWKNRAEDVEKQLKIQTESNKSSKLNAVDSQQIEFLTEERDQARTELLKAKQINRDLVELMDGQDDQTEFEHSANHQNSNQLEHEISNLKENVKEERRLRERAERNNREAELKRIENNKILENEIKDAQNSLKSEREARHFEQIRQQEIQNNNEQNKEQLLADLKNVFNQKVQKLESELDNIRQKENQKIQEVKNFHSKREREMREFFGEEKLRLERKTKKERENWKFRLEEMEEESEQRIGVERRERDEEVEGWEERVREAEEMGREWREQAEGERVQREQELTRQLSLFKQEATRAKTEAQSARQETKRWAEEREISKKEKEEEFKSIKEELIKQKKESQEIKLRFQHAQDSQIRAAKRLKENQIKWESEKAESQKAESEWKGERSNMAEQIIALKMNLTQEVAVSQQKLGFKDSKINDLEKRLENLIQESDNRRKEIEERFIYQNSENIKLHEKEIAECEKRSDGFRADLKALQGQVNEKSLQAEKAKTSLQEKTEQWEEEKKRVEDIKSKESDRLKGEVGRLRGQIKEAVGTHQQEVEALRVLKFDAEIAFTETLARLDKETALWKGRERFLSDQRTQTQRELKEMEKSFQTVLSKLQDYRRREKSNSSNGELTRKLEETQREARSRIEESENIHKEREIALTERIEVLEIEISRNERERQNRMAARFGLRLEEEKKLNQLLEREKTSQDAIMLLKYQKDQVALIAQRELEKERERLKTRIFETEVALKKTENEKNLLIFEQEKQKTKWLIEKDNLMFQKQEGNDMLQKLRRQKEHLTKENERLKGNIKVLKKSNLGHSIMSFARSRYFPNKAPNNPITYGKGSNYPKPSSRNNDHQNSDTVISHKTDLKNSDKRGIRDSNKLNSHEKQNKFEPEHGNLKISQRELLSRESFKSKRIQGTSNGNRYTSYKKGQYSARRD